jgi:hypothetical protein
MQPVTGEIRLNPQVEIGHNEHPQGIGDQQRRTLSNKFEVHNGLKTSLAG